jgi:hypothetical protein
MEWVHEFYRSGLTLLTRKTVGKRLIVDAEGSCFPTLLHSLCVRSRA